MYFDINILNPSDRGSYLSHKHRHTKQGGRASQKMSAQLQHDGKAYASYTGADTDTSDAESPTHYFVFVLMLRLSSCDRPIK